MIRGAQVAVYAETTPAEVARAIERADLAHDRRPTTMT
jgi:hypothetical protein